MTKLITADTVLNADEAADLVMHTMDRTLAWVGRVHRTHALAAMETIATEGRGSLAGERAMGRLREVSDTATELGLFALAAEVNLVLAMND